MCRPSGVREGEKVWEEEKKEAELGGEGVWLLFRRRRERGVL